MIIGLTGLIGSGKDTVADYLVHQYNFTQVSFADALKEVLSVMFGWDLQLLLGKSTESREFRETVDKWWSERLGIASFTPRFAMQHIGTSVMRNAFNDEIWIACLENKIRRVEANHIVISDVRFLNEANAITNAGGIIAQVTRVEPWWKEFALVAANSANLTEVKNAMDILVRHGVHESEFSFYAINGLYSIHNSGSIQDLASKVDAILGVKNAS